jgi:hypothetical protein
MICDPRLPDVTTVAHGRVQRYRLVPASTVVHVSVGMPPSAADRQRASSPEPQQSVRHVVVRVAASTTHSSPAAQSVIDVHGAPKRPAPAVAHVADVASVK